MDRKGMTMGDRHSEPELAEVKNLLEERLFTAFTVTAS